ncbi:MAG TPA: type 4a pilus biogenesis protein PilO [Gemmatimonadaceae bacterium]|nr:type 4a pilus biogenesis protein PilO [Gemmatimonadaceae bacterium]
MPLMPKGQREQSLVLVCLLAVAAIGAYGYLVFRPKAATLSAQRTRIATLDSLNRRAKIEIAHGSVEQLRQQLAQYQSNLELVRTLVPTGNEVPALLEQVSTAARRAGLDLASVQPQPVLQNGTYSTYSYNVGVLGGYHALGTLLSNVGSLTRIVLPTHVKLQLSTTANTGKSRKTADAAAIEAHFDLETFVVRKGAASDDAPRAAGGE